LLRVKQNDRLFLSIYNNGTEIIFPKVPINGTDVIGTEVQGNTTPGLLFYS